MLKILVQIVFSLTLIGNLYAIDIPIVQEMKIVIPLNKMSVIEFPFEVKKKSFTPFEYRRIKGKKENKKEIDPLKDEIALPEVKKLSPIGSIKQYGKKIKNKISKKTTSRKNITVTWGKNFVQFYPRKLGKTQLLLWGYKKFPMMLTIEISKNEESYNSYIKFIDPEQKYHQKRSLKSDSHEKTVRMLIRDLYNNKITSGYELERKEVHYIDEIYLIEEKKALVGKYYTATEYIIKNISKTKTLLNEPMFASKNTYGISFENRKLYSGETTRMFIVSPTITGD